MVPSSDAFDAIPNKEEQLNNPIEQGHDDYDIEFLIVDDGSNDRRGESLEKYFRDRPGFQLNKLDSNQGITAVIKTGVIASWEIRCAAWAFLSRRHIRANPALNCTSSIVMPSSKSANNHS